MSRQDIPEGYAVIQLADNQWYPVRVERFYSDAYPDGLLNLYPIRLDEQEQHFSRRKEAVAYCQSDAALWEDLERRRYERKTVESNVYPERCIHYQEIIQDITGYPPMVDRFYDGVSVYVPGYHCASCGSYHPHVVKEALTIEDALEACAEQVYAVNEQCTLTGMVRDLTLVTPL